MLTLKIMNLLTRFQKKFENQNSWTKTFTPLEVRKFDIPEVKDLSNYIVFVIHSKKHYFGISTTGIFIQEEGESLFINFSELTSFRILYDSMTYPDFKTKANKIMIASKGQERVLLCDEEGNVYSMHRLLAFGKRST